MALPPPPHDRRASPEVHTVGRYRLGGIIGTGGMGSVYEAVHTTLGLRAAIKTLKPALADNTVTSTRFMREGIVAARVRHPNAVAIYDVIEEGAASYLVMEFLEGETLKDLLDREVTLPYERAVDLLLPVLSAVSAAHDEDIVHRDLKPSNIFLARERTGIVTPKVLDFGLSWAADEERPTGDITRSGVVLGTLLYMAPEQVRNARQASAASDQYALGLILYQCLTGHKPFLRETQYDMMNAIVAGEHPPPRALHPELPAALDAVIERAMHVDPTLRFPSVGAFARSLQKFASPAVQWLWAPVFDVRPPELSAPAPVSSLPAVAAPVAPAAPEAPHWLAASPSRAVLIGGAACVACLALGIALGASARPEPVHAEPAAHPPPAAPPAALGPVAPAPPSPPPAPPPPAPPALPVRRRSRTAGRTRRGTRPRATSSACGRSPRRATATAAATTATATATRTAPTGRRSDLGPRLAAVHRPGLLVGDALEAVHRGRAAPLEVGLVEGHALARVEEGVLRAREEAPAPAPARTRSRGSPRSARARRRRRAAASRSPRPSSRRCRRARRGSGSFVARSL
jgi:tRNA A-37 threonylcarbamoyl transferase component Bud32